MAKIIIEDVDPLLIERLEARAKKNGRSLQSELKQILETSNSSLTDDDVEMVIQKAELLRQHLACHSKADISELQPIDRQRASTLIQEFRQLRQKISPSEMSIREMREEGRRQRCDLF